MINGGLHRGFEGFMGFTKFLGGFLTGIKRPALNIGENRGVDGRGPGMGRIGVFEGFMRGFMRVSEGFMGVFEGIRAAGGKSA